MSAREETYEALWRASVTQRAWEATPVGWNVSTCSAERPLPRKVTRLLEQELALGQAPSWGMSIIERMLGPLPMCGHYSFPRPLQDLCRAIGAQRCPTFVVGCYTADAGRKTLSSYYVYCLDAWLWEAPLEVAQAELTWRPNLERTWCQIASQVYDALGQRTPIKKLLVERLVHRLRWWIKTMVWDDDHRDRFMLDAYLGDVRGDEAGHGAYGNPPYGDPYFVELALPQVQAMEAGIRSALPDAKVLSERIRSTWLCAPKAFRYLERIIAQIGALDASADRKPGAILQCQDTWPDVDAARTWYRVFRQSLDDWLAGHQQALPELGAVTPVSKWLVSTLRLKLDLYEQHNPFGRLVGVG